MDIIVKTKNCDIPERLQRDAVDRVGHALRIYDRLDGIEMTFRSDAPQRSPESAVVELTARAKGHHIRARGVAGDHRSAVDAVLARFERQLRRHKARLIDTRRRATRAMPTRTGLIDAAPPGRSTDAAATPTSAAAGTVTLTPGEPLEPPPIVRRKRFELAPMTIEEAALNLELLDHEFYVFTNVHTAECNVVYRRRDGDLGLIEAQPADGLA